MAMVLKVESVDSFVYLGSLQKSEDNSRPDTKRRISLAGWQHQSRPDMA